MTIILSLNVNVIEFSSMSNINVLFGDDTEKV